MSEIGEGDTKVAVNRERAKAERELEYYDEHGVGNPEDIRRRLAEADQTSEQSSESPKPTRERQLGLNNMPGVSETAHLTERGRRKQRKVASPSTGLKSRVRNELIGRLSAGEGVEDLTSGNPAAQEFVITFDRSRK